jgi:hypothetical protein
MYVLYSVTGEETLKKRTAIHELPFMSLQS